MKILDRNTIIIYDDLTIPLGTIRISDHGSSGGQNGIKHVLSMVGQKSRLIRLRIGIAPNVPEQPKYDPFAAFDTPRSGDLIPDRIKFVLSKFHPNEQARLQQTKLWAIEALKSLLQIGISKTMTHFNKSLEDAAAAEKHREQQQIAGANWREAKRQDRPGSKSAQAVLSDVVNAMAAPDPAPDPAPNKSPATGGAAPATATADATPKS